MNGSLHLAPDDARRSSKCRPPKINFPFIHCAHGPACICVSITVFVFIFLKIFWWKIHFNFPPSKQGETFPANSALNFLPPCPAFSTLSESLIGLLSILQPNLFSFHVQSKFTFKFNSTNGDLMGNFPTFQLLCSFVLGGRAGSQRHLSATISST